MQKIYEKIIHANQGDLKTLCKSSVNVVVCSGLMSLLTIFQSYHDDVWLRLGAQCSLL